MGYKCPLWVKSRHAVNSAVCPASTPKADIRDVRIAPVLSQFLCVDLDLSAQWERQQRPIVLVARVVLRRWRFVAWVIGIGGQRHLRVGHLLPLNQLS